MTLLAVTLVASHSGQHDVPVVDDSLNPNTGANYTNTTLSDAESQFIQAYPNTQDPTPIAFLGSAIYANISHHAPNEAQYNITNPAGDLIDKDVNHSNTWLNLSTGNASAEGRYAVWDVFAPSGDGHRHVDLVSADHNVTGRFYSPMQGQPLSNVQMELRYWENLSKINTSGNNINITNSSWAAGGQEWIYRINTTTLEKYWIGVKADGRSWTHQASRGIQASMPGGGTVPSVPSPRVNDLGLVPDTTNVSGKLMYDDGTIASGVEVRLQSHQPSCPRCMGRSPRMRGPPVLTDITDENGYFNFTKVDSGSQQMPASYLVDIVNDSVARSSGSFFTPDIRMQNKSLKVKDAGTFNVSSSAGNISGTIDGDGSATYVVAAFAAAGIDAGSTSYMAVQDNLSNISLSSIPTGTYSIVAAKFVGLQPSETTAQTVEIKDGETTIIDFEFPETVNLTGYVNDTSGSPVSDATVTAENRSEFRTHSATTAADGTYTVQVVNGTSYDVTVRPAFDSSYVETTANIDITTSETDKNFTLSDGAWLTGKVKDSSGSPVTATVAIWSSGNGGTYQEDETNSSGIYNISGLESGTTYNFDVYPHDSGVSENHSDFTLTANQEWRNVTLDTDTRNISGFITNTASAGLNATIRLVNHNKEVSTSVDTNSSGGYSFTGKPRHSYYTLRVQPDNTSYGAEERSFSLSDTRTNENFTLETTASLSGYVKDGSGGVENAEVFAYNFTIDSYGWTQTNTDGSYKLTMREGNYSIEARKTGYTPNRTMAAEVSVGSKQNLTLSQGVDLSGHITENNLETSYNGTIGVWNHTANAFGHADIVNGEYNITGLQDGVGYNVWFTVDKDDFTPSIESVNLGPMNTPYTKNFSAGGNAGQKLNISVTSGGEPLPNATVRTPLREKETNAGGFVTFPNQSIGSIAVSANKDGYRGVLKKDVEIKSPGQLGVENYETLTLSLDQMAETKVDVNVTSSNNPVSGASVVFVSNESGISQQSSAATGSDGQVTVDGLVDGDYLLIVATSEEDINSEAVTLDASASGETRTGFDGSNYDVWFDARR